jgi:hypothetical protein
MLSGALLMLLVPAIRAGEVRGHVPQEVWGLSSSGRLPSSHKMRLALGVPLRNQAALSNLLQELYEPASPNFRHYLTSSEFNSRFAPTEKEYESVVDFARSNHFTLLKRHSNRMVLDVSASAGDVEKAFGLTLKTFHDVKTSHDFFAPDSEPVLPPGGIILDVCGLTDVSRPKPMLADDSQSSLAATLLPRSGSGAGGSFLGNDFRAAYLPGVNLRGTGESLALVEFDGFYANDIATYESLASITNVPLATVLLDGFNGMPSPDRRQQNIEVSLDIELALALAPGLSSVIVYEAGPSGIPNDILNRIASDNLARQVSCSWAWTGGPSDTTDQIFQQMAAQGQSFYCASGDTGAYTAGQVDNASLPNAPSDSPYITIVGGTTLTTSGPGGTWQSETVWNRGGGVASSGGVSSYYDIPQWQQGVSMNADGVSATKRNIPDVAMVADGVFVSCLNGTNTITGGTSCAAPLWASFNALLNQQLLASNLPPVGFMNPRLYPLAGRGDYSSLFHDVTSGDNTNPGSPFKYAAAAGFDLCTGLGSPDGAALINTLTLPQDNLVLSPSGGFVASGLQGGPFNTTSQSISLTNSGQSALGWVATSASSWLSVSSASGVIPPNSAGTMFSVTLNTNASQLTHGTNFGLVYVTNLNSGNVQFIRFTLQILQRLVQNGGFEQNGLISWIKSGNPSYISVLQNSSYTHTGSFGLQAGPSSSIGYLSQIIPVSVSNYYLVSFWLDNPASGTPNSFTCLWNDAPLFAISNSPVFAWTNIQRIVTASTNLGILKFGFRNDNAYFGMDDVSVTPFLPPSLHITLQSNSARIISWNTIPGLTYQPQYKDTITQTNWLNIGGNLSSTNSTLQILDNSVVSPQRFYRVQVMP